MKISRNRRNGRVLAAVRNYSATSVAAHAFLFILLTVLVGIWISTASAQKSRDRSNWCDEDWYGDRPTACEVREYTLDGSLKELDVDGGQNGGIEVVGWDRDEIRVLARVKTWARSEEQAGDMLSRVTVHADGSEIRSEIDDERRMRKRGWSVSYRISVPRRIDLTLEANNGGISIEDVDGLLRLSTVNGGISLRQVAGDVRGETTNGGLSVALSGDEWSGRGLDVRTTNGGVSLLIPEDYSADLETGTRNGGLQVDFPVTMEGRIGKKIRTRLGDGGAHVRVSTTNGGVRIRRI